MKKILIMLGTVLLSGTAMAQFENTDVNKRLEMAVGNDSVLSARSYITQYQSGCEEKNWKEAYTAWTWLMKNAPFAITGLHKGNAPFMLYNLVATEKDPAQKKVYYDDLMRLFDLRAQRLDSLNSMETNPKLRSTLGDVLSVKAEYYNWTAPTVQGSGYSLNKSHENFKQATQMINEKGGREVTPSFLQTFFQVSDALYKAYDKKDVSGKSISNSWREQYLQDYLDSKDACEQMLNLAKEAAAAGDSARAEQINAKYEGPLGFIETTFANSGAADREQIIALYTKKFDSYKTSIDKLNSAINLMAQNDCDDAPIYFQYAKAAYDIKPTYTAAIGLAQKAQKDGNANQALQYYNKALELASSDNIRGKICLNVARALASSGAYNKSSEYINKAIEYNPDIKGAAYFQQANSLAKAQDLKGAIAYCDKAASADITYKDRANKLKSQINTAMQAQANNAKLQAKYQEYLRKKAAEEAFWKAGH